MAGKGAAASGTPGAGTVGGTPGGGGAKTQAASVRTAAAKKSARIARNGADMGWIIFEASVALLIALAIVWWTVSPARKRDRQREAREHEDEASAKPQQYD